MRFWNKSTNASCSIRVRSKCLLNKWPTILASNYHGMKISSMKDGFIHKLNIMVTSLRSVHRDADMCIKIPWHYVSAARWNTTVDVQPPNSPLQLLRVATAVRVGYKSRTKNIFVIKIIIGQYCHWIIVLECKLGILH